MESELKEFNCRQSNHSESTNKEQIEERLVKDDRPLLKIEPSISSQSNYAEDFDQLEKKYLPYVRRDVYGVMGRGHLPLHEKILVGIALLVFVPIRLVLGIIVLICYYMICRLCTLYSVPNRENDQEDEQEDYAHMCGWRRIVIIQSGRILSRAMLFILGFYWITHSCRDDSCGDTKLAKQDGCSGDTERPGAVISNHVSYIDILYHMSSSFPSFVAKRSVGKLPLIGLISKCLGCVYVQRESKSSDFKGVSGIITERMKEAHENEYAPRVMLFPEGTTSNGDFLLPFKTGGFVSKAPVLPVIVKYPYKRFSPAWDSISGMRHVVLLLCQFVNYMEVDVLPLYMPSQEEKDDPIVYAENVRRLMADEGNLVMSDLGLAEKRLYHLALNGNTSLHSQKQD